MKNCNSCFFFLVDPPNKNGDAFCRCGRYVDRGFLGVTGKILDTENMRVVDGDGFSQGQLSPKLCTDWISKEEQELINKGW